jgi:hypothetical protein
MTQNSLTRDNIKTEVQKARRMSFFKVADAEERGRRIELLRQSLLTRADDLSEANPELNISDLEKFYDVHDAGSLESKLETSSVFPAAENESFQLPAPDHDVRDHIIVICADTRYVSHFLIALRRREKWYNNFHSRMGSERCSEFGFQEVNHSVVIVSKEDFDRSHFHNCCQQELEKVFFVKGSGLDLSALIRAGALLAKRVSMS